MGKVVYSMITSADGYIEDSNGSIEFFLPDEEVHQAANEQTRQASAFLFGRRMFEMMEEPWRATADRDDAPEVEAEFARLYMETPRYVFSDTIETVPDGVRLVRSADAVAEVQRLKRETEGELAVGGAGLAASLVDLVDEFQPYVMPVVVGGGKPFFPAGVELKLQLAEQRTFASGTVFLRYTRA
ncbi:dihydrofolate reductase family protein [Phytoactinopolyspora endophytica]|uniref:dihydrofolate reductase family protein n=1 Tax=Phytoactinopolyspora endophytica TaxID=1642495 RepID=UPI00101BD8CB|nr:dihydrofolate reductase family protein [Phytoactinopolyspora endophytica]